MKPFLLSIFALSASLLSAQTFTQIIPTPFTGVVYSAMAFSDVDGDGDSDVLVTGSDISLDPKTKLYTNNGSGIFTQVTGTLSRG